MAAEALRAAEAQLMALQEELEQERSRSIDLQRQWTASRQVGFLGMKYSNESRQTPKGFGGLHCLKVVFSFKANHSKICLENSFLIIFLNKNLSFA